MVVDPVLHATLHVRFEGHTTPPDELPAPDEPPLLLLPPNTMPLDAPLDAPLEAPLPLLAPLLLVPPEEPKPLPLLLPPQAGARRSAAVEAKVAQLTASVRRFMTRVSPKRGERGWRDRDGPRPSPRRWIVLPRILKSVSDEARIVCVSRERCGRREKFQGPIQCRLP
jgi:hypothetical protein